MTAEEISGPAGPKLLRLVFFVGAGGNPIPSMSSLSLSLSHAHNYFFLNCIGFNESFSVICTAAINKWREYERNTIIQQQQQQQRVVETHKSSESVAAPKTLK